MAHITTFVMPDEVTKLMEGFGLHQQQAISPYVKWSDGRTTIQHHKDLYPQTIGDVVELIYDNGVNFGAFSQREKMQSAIMRTVESMIDVPLIVTKV